MEHAMKADILRQARHCLKRNGVLNQYQYFPGELSSIPLPFRRRGTFTVHELLARYFQRVEATHVLRNCPPARVFLCRR
jgi:phospholipid N-methyltransferase